MSKRIQIIVHDRLFKLIEQQCSEYGIGVSEYVRGLMIKELESPKGGSLLNTGTPKNLEEVKIEELKEKEKLVEVPHKLEGVNVGFCQGHFEKGTQYELKKHRREDENGELLWEKDICEKCADKERLIIENRGGKLF